jgi:hypothetical protein
LKKVAAIPAHLRVFRARIDTSLMLRAAHPHPCPAGSGMSQTCLAFSNPAPREAKFALRPCRPIRQLTDWTEYELIYLSPTKVFFLNDHFIPVIIG